LYRYSLEWYSLCKCFRIFWLYKCYSIINFWRLCIPKL